MRNGLVNLNFSNKGFEPMIGQEEGGGAESLGEEKRINGVGEELQRLEGKRKELWGIVGEAGEKPVVWRNRKLHGIM